MDAFRPVKVENYEFYSTGLNEYEPSLVYIKDDIDIDGRVYFVKNMFYSKLKEWMDSNLNIVGNDRITVDKNSGGVVINAHVEDLEYSIREINRKIEELREEIEEKKKCGGRIYNLMDRIGEINNGTICSDEYLLSLGPNRRKYSYIE